DQSPQQGWSVGPRIEDSSANAQNAGGQRLENQPEIHGPFDPADQVGPNAGEEVMHGQPNLALHRRFGLKRLLPSIRSSPDELCEGIGWLVRACPNTRWSPTYRLCRLRQRRRRLFLGFQLAQDFFHKLRLQSLHHAMYRLRDIVMIGFNAGPGSGTCY